MAWTELTFPFGSLLTSTKMTQLDANLDALAAGDAGAPKIQQAAIDSSQVGQGELKTTTGEVSQVNGGAGSKTLPGGTYGFYPQVKEDGDGAAVVQISALATGGTYVTIIYLNYSSATTGTLYAQHRYFQASPPYKIGNINWGHFLFLLRNISTGKIMSSYQAEDPPWAYNGPEWNKKDSKERIEAAPHPFVDYYDKDPLVDGLEIQLIDLSEVNVLEWKKNNAKKDKSILSDLSIINPKGRIVNIEGTDDIKGFDKIKLMKAI
jgi:hypothetical protein